MYVCVLGGGGGACPCLNQHNIIFLSDDTLTLSNALAVVRTVQVEKLGYILGVPDTKLEEMMQQTSDEERRKRMIKYFLHTHPNASWTWLGGKLMWQEQDAAAKAAKEYIKFSPGES